MMAADLQSALWQKRYCADKYITDKYIYIYYEKFGIYVQDVQLFRYDSEVSAGSITSYKAELYGFIMT